MYKTRLFQIIILIFTICIHAAGAQEHLFINTDPIGASVFVNNEDTRQVTPCIIRGISSRFPPKIRIAKEGYRDYVIKQSDYQDGVATIQMTPVSFTIYFPMKTRFRIGTSTAKGPLSLNNMKSGNYNFSIVDDQILVSRYTNFMPVEAGLGAAVGLSLVWMVTSIILSEVFYQEFIDKSRDDPTSRDAYYYKKLDSNFQPVKFTSIGVTAAFTVALTSVIITDIVLRTRAKKQKYEIVTKPSSDEVFFETSKLYLGQGEIEKSIRILKLFISMYPDSNLIPSAYYQLGQNYFILEDYDSALENWIVFIDDYPLSEYYDYVLKNISDIYYQRNEYVTAKQWLDRTLYTTDKASIEEILSFKARLDTRLFQQSGNMDFFFAAEGNYLNLITNFTRSARLDTYFSQLIELYSSNNDADKLKELKEKAGSLDIEDEALLAIILSLFE
jgi:tetratricopeptide (TPR) repeat protein